MGKSKTLIVNFFGTPGSGKSTTMGAVFSELKWKGVNCEVAPEFVKELVWEKRRETILNELYIFGKQHHRISRLIGKVDVVITDSPLLLCVVHKPDYMSDNFSRLVYEEFFRHDSLNYFLRRKKKYEPKGRLETEEESDRLRDRLLEVLKPVKYKELDGCKESVQIIVNDILEYLAKRESVSIGGTPTQARPPFPPSARDTS